MIEINITPDQIERAANLYSFGALKNSIMKGGSNNFGALGEIIVNDYFLSIGKDVNHLGHYDYDFIIEGKRVDVKTKKVFRLDLKNVKATVAAFNTYQNCDFYFFTQVLSDMSKGYLLGYMQKDEFYEKAIFKHEGDLDDNGFIFTADCYNINARDLKRFKSEEDLYN
jgi:hypothetical protein